MGICVIGLHLESLLPISDRFVNATFCIKNITAVVIGVCIIRLQSYCLLVMHHRFIGSAFSGEGVSKIHLLQTLKPGRNEDLAYRT